MSKYLLTGAGGFVARHFLDHLEEMSETVDVLGVDIVPLRYKGKQVRYSFRKINLLDTKRIESCIESYQPDRILHLASFSSVGLSWRRPSESFRNNTNIFLNLLEAVRKYSPRAKILSVGSSEEYGNVDPEDLPLTEKHSLDPVSPYAVARISQEMLAKVYCAGYKLKIVNTRSFNHIGPFQHERFVVPSFARQIVLAKKNGMREVTIKAGNVQIIRDFVDVRDVVRAYDMLLINGRIGETYNICSGNGIRLEDLIHKLGAMAGINVKIEIDPDLVRPGDNMAIVGSFEKINNDIGWKPEIPFDACVRDILGYWEKTI